MLQREEYIFLIYMYIQLYIRSKLHKGFDFVNIADFISKLYKYSKRKVFSRHTNYKEKNFSIFYRINIIKRKIGKKLFFDLSIHKIFLHKKFIFLFFNTHK